MDSLSIEGTSADHEHTALTPGLSNSLGFSEKLCSIKMPADMMGSGSDSQGFFISIEPISQGDEKENRSSLLIYNNNWKDETKKFTISAAYSPLKESYNWEPLKWHPDWTPFGIEVEHCAKTIRCNDSSLTKTKRSEHGQRVNHSKLYKLASMFNSRQSHKIGPDIPNMDTTGFNGSNFGISNICDVKSIHGFGAVEKYKLKCHIDSQGDYYPVSGKIYEQDKVFTRSQQRKQQPLKSILKTSDQHCIKHGNRRNVRFNARREEFYIQKRRIRKNIKPNCYLVFNGNSTTHPTVDRKWCVHCKQWIHPNCNYVRHLKTHGHERISRTFYQVIEKLEVKTGCHFGN